MVWVIRRHELSDDEWEFVRPLLPVSLRGRKRLDDRRILNGIAWKLIADGKLSDEQQAEILMTLVQAMVAGPPQFAPVEGQDVPPRAGR
ncbi:hypothetical protein [Streptomyces anulatus]|uniref:hypothetical protein n=1 Tax=Streptomyces anulatus TaxID=1892 RepID=UPI00343EDFD6